MYCVTHALLVSPVRLLTGIAGVFPRSRSTSYQASTPFSFLTYTLAFRVINELCQKKNPNNLRRGMYPWHGQQLDNTQKRFLTYCLKLHIPRLKLLGLYASEFANGATRDSFIVDQLTLLCNTIDFRC
jgi:hypothetical protein